MKEGKVEAKKDFNIWKGFFIAVVIISAFGALFGYIYHRDMENKLMNKVNISTKYIEEQKQKIAGCETTLDSKNKEVEKAKKAIAGIKDKNDLLKRDIELYIDTTHPKVPNVVGKEIAKQIVDLARKHKVSPELIVGIIKIESAFNPMAVGPKTKYGHARGLMQVMPEWSKKLGLKSQYDFHNIDVGIESGIKVFLIHLEEGKGDISTGLYYYVNKDKSYVGKVYAAMGKFVAFRNTIDEETQNVETEIELNGDSKPMSDGKKSLKQETKGDKKS